MDSGGSASDTCRIAPAVSHNDKLSGYFHSFFGSRPITISPPHINSEANDTYYPSTPSADDWTFGLFRQTSVEDSASIPRNATWHSFSLFGRNQTSQALGSTAVSQPSIVVNPMTDNRVIATDSSRDNHDSRLMHTIDDHKGSEKVTFSFFQSPGEEMRPRSDSGSLYTVAGRGSSGSRRASGETATVVSGSGSRVATGVTSTVAAGPSVQQSIAAPAIENYQKGSILAAYNDVTRVPSSVTAMVSTPEQMNGTKGFEEGSVKHTTTRQRRSLFDNEKLPVKRKEINMIAPTSM